MSTNISLPAHCDSAYRVTAVEPNIETALGKKLNIIYLYDILLPERRSNSLQSNDFLSKFRQLYFMKCSLGLSRFFFSLVSN